MTSGEQETHSIIERKAEALVVMRFFNFDFPRCAQVLGIPENKLRKWADQLDESQKSDTPLTHLNNSRLNPNYS